LVVVLRQIKNALAIIQLWFKFFAESFLKTLDLALTFPGWLRRDMAKHKHQIIPPSRQAQNLKPWPSRQA